MSGSGPVTAHRPPTGGLGVVGEGRGKTVVACGNLNAYSCARALRLSALGAPTGGVQA